MKAKPSTCTLGCGERGTFLLIFAVGIVPLLLALWSIFFDLYLFFERGVAVRRYFDEAVTSLGSGCCSEERRRRLQGEISDRFGGSASVSSSHGQVSLSYREAVPVTVATLLGLSVLIPLDIRASVGSLPVMANVALDLSGVNAPPVSYAEFFDGEYQKLFIPRADPATLTSRCFGEPLLSRKRAAITLLRELGEDGSIKLSAAVFPTIGGGAEWISEDAAGSFPGDRIHLPRYGDDILNNQLCAAASTGEYAFPDRKGARQLADLVDRSSWEFREERLASLSASEALWVQASRELDRSSSYGSTSDVLIELAFDAVLRARGGQGAPMPMLIILSGSIPHLDLDSPAGTGLRARWNQKLEELRALVAQVRSARERAPLRILYVLTLRPDVSSDPSLIRDAEELFRESSNELLSFVLLAVEPSEALPTALARIMRAYAHRGAILR